MSPSCRYDPSEGPLEHLEKSARQPAGRCLCFSCGSCAPAAVSTAFQTQLKKALLSDVPRDPKRPIKSKDSFPLSVQCRPIAG